MGAPVPRERVASANPKAKGTETARKIQASRIDHAGMAWGSGTKARTIAAARGHTIPKSRMGHAAAAPTRADSHTFSLPLVVPKSATTAHPNRAPTTRPSERDMRARTACTIAMVSA